jgi:hypothetical protein
LLPASSPFKDDRVVSSPTVAGGNYTDDATGMAREVANVTELPASLSTRTSRSKNALANKAAIERSKVPDREAKSDEAVAPSKLAQTIRGKEPAIQANVTIDDQPVTPNTSRPLTLAYGKVAIQGDSLSGLEAVDVDKTELGQVTGSLRRAVSAIETTAGESRTNFKRDQDKRSKAGKQDGKGEHREETVGGRQAETSPLPACDNVIPAIMPDHRDVTQLEGMNEVVARVSVETEVSKSIDVDENNKKYSSRSRPSKDSEPAVIDEEKADNVNTVQIKSKLAMVWTGDGIKEVGPGKVDVEEADHRAPRREKVSAKLTKPVSPGISSGGSVRA